MIAHVPVIFGHGHGRENGGLPGSYGHVGGVHYQDGAVHEPSVRPGVLQLTELLDQVRHLVSPLAAAHVDDDINVGELGDGLLQDGLACAEPAGYDRGSAAGEGIEEVNASLACDHRFC